MRAVMHRERARLVLEYLSCRVYVSLWPGNSDRWINHHSDEGANSTCSAVPCAGGDSRETGGVHVVERDPASNVGLVMESRYGVYAAHDAIV
jgi:hypothetical protein